MTDWRHHEPSEREYKLSFITPLGHGRPASTAVCASFGISYHRAHTLSPIFAQHGPKQAGQTSQAATTIFPARDHLIMKDGKGRSAHFADRLWLQVGTIESREKACFMHNHGFFLGKGVQRQNAANLATPPKHENCPVQCWDAGADSRLLLVEQRPTEPQTGRSCGGLHPAPWFLRSVL